MSSKTVFTVQITLTVPPTMTTYDAQQTFLEELPVRFGHSKLYDARIVGGLVDANDVPIDSGQPLGEFNISPWFDALVNYAKRKELPTILEILGTLPSKTNLERLRAEVGIIGRPNLRNSIRYSIDAILQNKKALRDTFKYRYHSYSRGNVASQVSATGSLFSLMRQAITYHKDAPNEV